jgi:hypothetical protein
MRLESQRQGFVRNKALTVQGEHWNKNGRITAMDGYKAVGHGIACAPQK